MDFIASQRLEMLLKGRIDFCLFTFHSSFCQTSTFRRTLLSVSPPRSFTAQLLLFPLSSLLHLSCHFSLSLFSLFGVPPPALSSTIFLHRCSPLHPFRLASPPSFLVTSPPCLSLCLWLPRCVCRKCTTPLGVCADQQRPVWDIQDAGECCC